MANLITSALVIILVAVFAGFNRDNRCDVNLLFHTFRQAPVFVTILISFVAGIIVALPFLFTSGRKNAAKKFEQMKAKTEADIRAKIQEEEDRKAAAAEKKEQEKK